MPDCDVTCGALSRKTSFERHRGTGRVVLGTRYVRAFDMGEKSGVPVVLEAVRGQLQGWTMIPVRRGYLDKQRYGRLLYARPGE